MKSPWTVQLALKTAVALAMLALAGCGSSPSTASNPTASPAAAAKAPCTETAVLVSIRAKYDSAKTKVTLPSNADLVCASGYAKITIFIAVDKLCNSSGQPVKPLPAKLGPVCGVQ